MATEPKYWPAGGSTPVPSITSAASAFIVEHSRLLDFDAFSARSIADKLQSTSNAGALEHQKNPLAHNKLLLELLLTRTVDNFLCFLSDLLALIYKSKPEMLRSNESEKLDFILQFETMDQLRSALAEKRVERLSYLGLRELHEHFDSQMSFKLFESPDSLHRASLIVELRNIYVHARGVVGGHSTRRFPDLSEHAGKRAELSTSQVISDRKFLEDCVFDIDIRAAAKFSLPNRTLPSPPPDM